MLLDVCGVRVTLYSRWLVVPDVTTYCPLLCLFQPVTVTAMRANVASIWKFTAYRGPRVVGCALNVDIRPRVAIVSTVQRATIRTQLNPSHTIRLAKVGTAFSFLFSCSRVTVLVCFSFQPASVTCTPGVAVSIRNYTFYRVAKVVGFALNVGTTRPGVIASTVRKAFTAIVANPLFTEKHVKVGVARRNPTLLLLLTSLPLSFSSTHPFFSLSDTCFGFLAFWKPRKRRLPWTVMIAIR